MNVLEKEWIARCQKDPKKYQIIVGNDDVSVNNVETEECVFSFNSFGEQFILNLLEHIGCNAESA